MTQEQFSEACKLQKEIELLQQKNSRLERMTEELKESNKYTNVQDIKIQLLNNTCVSTTTGNVDYSDLINFLVRQRLKNEEKIDNLKEAFDEI